MRLKEGCRYSEEGFALIAVLWATTLLLTVVSAFIFSVRVETQAVANFREAEKARFLAVAGMNLALAEIGSDYDLVYAGNDGKIVFAKGEKDLSRTEREVELESGTVTYTIEDEQGKLNVNTVTREALAELLRITGVQQPERDVIADSVLDWRDKNHEFHLNGAEDDHYLALREPYEAKDGFFDTAEDLLLVKGVTPSIFYGDGNLPPEYLYGESSPRSYFSEGHEGISRLVTVHGSGRININTAGEKVLDAIFGKGRAMEIMLRRKTEGLFRQAAYGGAVSSNTFTIISKGSSNGIEAEIRAVAVRTPGTGEVRVTYWSES